MKVRRLNARSAEFEQQFRQLVSQQPVGSIHSEVHQLVAEIITDIQSQGDKALLQYTQKFDRVHVASVAELEISPQRIQQSLDQIDSQDLQALTCAAQRIDDFHRKQLQQSWSYKEQDGTELGQLIRPLQRVGIYVPGGKASYPSSVMMNAIPAKVAGVEEVIMAVPAPDGELNELVIAAAALAKVDRVFKIGGSQAIAALAYGTETVPAVDKIVGPGNQYVATAKRQVFGQVGIDMIAGPSEILIICDGETNPDWIAMDMFSQAEHDESAQAILVSPDGDFLDAVAASIDKLITNMPRRQVIQASLQNRGALIQVADIDEAIDLSNSIAPEHLELSLAGGEKYLPRIKHAGAIFVGRYTAEALGDYCAGPSHVLPTSGTARFSSPLGVYDFQKKTSLIHCSPSGASELGKVAQRLSNGEGLPAHGQSAAYRIKEK